MATTHIFGPFRLPGSPETAAFSSGPYRDRRAVHVLQEAGGGALVLITHCGKPGSPRRL